ncbi:MAG TPA: flagellar motor protein MotD [Arenimonas sp.]|nr:flagellar motor protein MotD [Arenimonas sp.]
MARKHKHEDHINHEAWAIPYGDLVTLLLAFFVVMYAISSLNEGKYRVLSESLNDAFGGPKRSTSPIQAGTRPLGDTPPPPIQIVPLAGPIAPVPGREWSPENTRLPSEAELKQGQENLEEISERIIESLADLIERDLVEVKRSPLMLQVEIKTDVFFASGSATPNAAAVDTMRRLAVALQPYPNPIRIEGHTDNVPISTFQFPTNWELSAARAASMVHVFMDYEVDPKRLTVVGYAEQVPKQSNDDAIGRAANRRVVLVILALPESLQSEQDAAVVPLQDVREEIEGP